MRAYLIPLLLGTAVGAPSAYVSDYYLFHTSQEHDQVINAGAAGLGPTAPTWTVNQSCVGLTFPSDAESARIKWEVPDCWDGTDVTLRIYWCGQAGDAVANTETVKWDIAYRSIVWGTEDTNQGTIATGTVTYTQSGGDANEYDTWISSITIPASTGNQPLAAGDSLAIQFDRDDATDTYSGNPIVAKWEIEYYQNQPYCDHN